MNQPDLYFPVFGQLSWANTVSILGREEGFTVKYGLSPVVRPKGNSEGVSHFYRISRLESKYRHYHIPNKDSAGAVGAVAIAT